MSGGFATRIRQSTGIDRALTFPVDCLTSDVVGDLLYVTGPAIAGRYQVAKADSRDRGKMPVVGVLLTKSSSTTGVLQVHGELRGVYTGLTSGGVYYVGIDGRPSAALPVPTFGGRAYFQTIGVALDTAVLLLNPEAIFGVVGG